MTGAASFASVLAPTSLPRYVWWRLGGRRSTVQLKLRDGLRILLRPRSPTANDFGVAYEIFVHRHYACPRPLDSRDIRLVVDLGANVGFSCLYWLNRFPDAWVITCEPHPANLAQCRANLAINRLQSRVTLHAAAAGAEPGRIVLSDAGASSTVQPDGANGIAADMVDIFAELAGRSVDLLKMDIEGGEYAILRDPRFPALRVARLVMEWHGVPADRLWCLSHLDGLGYDVVELFDNESYGMFWAFHRHPASQA